MTHTIIIIGAHGKMGTTTCVAVEQSNDFELVAKLGKADDIQKSILQHQPDIVIDFTNAAAVYENTLFLLSNNIKTVVGASGLTFEQVEQLEKLAREQQTGCIIAPNFSIGAILMMRFAAQAARFFPEAEIVETHHQQKLDAPSGTAVKTAEMIKSNRRQQKNINESIEQYPGARGAEVADVNIHAVRLPGYVASQQVLFGGQGENLTIQHNSINRECFMPGVLLACREVLKLDSLIYGLENFLI
jgi:4-hydroxy-tetrahydrodipicolinate reductase